MIKILDDFLTKEECLELIEMGSKKMQKATTLGAVIDGYRTADNSWLYESTPLTEKIQTFIAKESGLPVENQENIHIVKYDIGGEYKPHHDYFHPNEEYYQGTMGNAGNRVFSFLIYLNHNFTGGETDFPTKKILVTPKEGRVLAWRNMKEDGSLDAASYHAGLPVKTQTKYIAIVWVRERAFREINK
jgi:prolyl 4-hydroxylase